MAARGAGCLTEAMGALRIASKTAMPSRVFNRSMATEAASPAQMAAKAATASTTQTIINNYHPTSTVPLTIHAFPSLEPTALEHWSTSHLYLPLRRDLLHAAVIYEADNTRQGTASSKTRWDVAGSHRKIRPQKGSGRARLGTRQSPILRGGGKAHGPHPRDFGTKLNAKVYDKAWRTALSYRYRRGELIVCEDGMELKLPHDFFRMGSRNVNQGLEDTFLEKYMASMLRNLGLGREDGRTLFITGDESEMLFKAMEQVPQHGRALGAADVDVKDLLETGKVVMEKSVLKEMIEMHQSDLVARLFINRTADNAPVVGGQVVGKLVE